MCKIFVCLLALVICTGVGYYVGHGMASGTCAKRELGVVVQATKAMAGVVEAGRLEVARQQQSTVQASVREAAASVRKEGNGI